MIGYCILIFLLNLLCGHQIFHRNIFTASNITLYDFFSHMLLKTKLYCIQFPVNLLFQLWNARFIYGKPDVPKASPETSSEVHKEIAELQRNEKWDAAVQLVVEAGDPKARFITPNDWYRLRRSLEIIKVVS